jgi:hypothetical protein
MGTFIGGVIGLGIGLALSYFFIFPTDILSMKLIDLTIGDLLRILAGLVVTLFATLFCGAIGGAVRD